MAREEFVGLAPLTIAANKQINQFLEMNLTRHEGDQNDENNKK